MSQLFEATTSPKITKASFYWHIKDFTDMKTLSSDIISPCFKVQKLNITVKVHGTEITLQTPDIAIFKHQVHILSKDKEKIKSSWLEVVIHIHLHEVLFIQFLHALKVLKWNGRCI